MEKRKVVICKELKPELEAYLKALKFDKVFILTDENTLKDCYPVLQDISLLSSAPVFTVGAGDIHKNIDEAAKLWSCLCERGASRNSLLINLGGGMITDMGGFVGATFKRGIQTINIPTTLMASVDAAVGGKTGINFNGLKNEIGSFYPPLCVFIYNKFLRTLDQANILSGYAEMIKHALISNRDVYTAVFSFEPDSGDLEQLDKLVARSVAIKEYIVEEDPKERGIRKALNLGHTIGHAYESLSFKKNRPLLHGHAVAAGLIGELYLSHKTCGFPMHELSRIVYYIKTYYAPFIHDCDDYESLYELMTHDKKNEGGIINFTLLSNIGEVRINQAVDKQQILSALDFYRESFGI